MEIINGPWDNRLWTLVNETQKTIKIISPFIKMETCKTLIQNKPTSTRLQLITSLNISSVCFGSLDLPALDLILKNKGKIKNYPKVHAKVYIFDEDTAIVTSSNLTPGGLKYNFEYGILIQEEKYVQKIIYDFNEAFYSDACSNVTSRDLDFLAKLSQKIVRPSLHFNGFSDSQPEIEISYQILTEVLSGWKKEVFQKLNEIDKSTIQLKDLLQFVPEFHKLYPNNHYIEAKIRQTLQF
ncbi:MAG: phospholipase D-like domain-containing protein [Flavobacteriales bacterium]|nr:phospholipase D-like domain-containing protein [Flavobacteriales bacterium]MCX7649079.1 phospholipase D-like domain-containing protein [Flavobacteriales bacterium]MDW8431156.1 phospholipase D-like domain-containing protein [Flavobacteriales bacterium]